MRGESEAVSSSGEELRQKVDALRWYHTLDLGEGVVTPGFYDHRPNVLRYGIPDDLSGVRALDVGQQDGFWSFELERRGAEVTGIDLPGVEQLDWPPRIRTSGIRRELGGFPLADDSAFRVAREALGSRVERVSLTTYEASPERLGTFDLVFVGSVLVHLRDPMLALERLASLCTGTLIVCEPYSRRLRLIPWGNFVDFTGESAYMTWWMPSIRAWQSMVRCAGFDDVRLHGRFNMRFAQTRGGVRHAVFHARPGA